MTMGNNSCIAYDIAKLLSVGQCTHEGIYVCMGRTQVALVNVCIVWDYSTCITKLTKMMKFVRTLQ